MRNKFLCKICLIIALVFAFSTSAFAQSNEVVLEDNRTLTPTGNAQLLDDVTDNENLQFITVTARDGNVFYLRNGTIFASAELSDGKFDGDDYAPNTYYRMVMEKVTDAVS